MVHILLFSVLLLPDQYYCVVLSSLWATGFYYLLHTPAGRSETGQLFSIILINNTKNRIKKGASIMFRDILVGIMAVAALIVGITAFIMENKRVSKSDDTAESATDSPVQK